MRKNTLRTAPKAISNSTLEKLKTEYEKYLEVNDQNTALNVSNNQAEKQNNNEHKLLIAFGLLGEKVSSPALGFINQYKYSRLGAVLLGTSALMLNAINCAAFVLIYNGYLFNTLCTIYKETSRDNITIAVTSVMGASILAAVATTIIATYYAVKLYQYEHSDYYNLFEGIGRDGKIAAEFREGINNSGEVVKKKTGPQGGK